MKDNRSGGPGQSRPIGVRAEQNGHAARVEGTAAPPSDAEAAAALAVVRCIHGKRVGDATRRALAAPPLSAWLDLFDYLSQSAGVSGPAARLALAEQWLANLAARRGAEARAVAGALASALEQAERDGVEDEPEPRSGPDPFSLGVLGSSSLASKTFRREWLVKRIAVRGQPGIVGGPRKGLKTSQLVDFVISLAAACRFLGVFEVPRPTKTLFLSGESGDATIQETARRVCAAKGLVLDELEGYAFWGFRLPQLSNPEHLDELARFLRENGIEVVVIDPLYLCLLSGNSKLDPANLFDVGPLLSRVTETCLAAGATPFFAHHLRKNRDDPHSPPELEDLAYAGVQEFARQWIMIGRREQYEPGTGEHRLWLSVGGSAGHSGAWAVDVSEGVVDDDFQGRRWDVAVTGATDARVAGEAQQQAAEADREVERARAKDEARARRLGEEAEIAMQSIRRLGPTTMKAWRDDLNFSGERFSPIQSYLLKTEQIRSCVVRVKCGRGYTNLDGFEAAAAPHRDTPGHTGTTPGRTEPSRSGTPGPTPGRDGPPLRSKGSVPRPGVPVSHADPDGSKTGEDQPHRDGSPGEPEGPERDGGGQ